MHAMEKSSVRSLLGKLSALARIQETPIHHWQFTCAVPLETGGARKIGDPFPITPPQCWEGEAAFFETDTIIPAWAAQFPLYLRFRNGGENLLRINGQAVAGFDANHEYVPLNIDAGESLHLEIEGAHRWQHLAHAKQFGMETSPQIFQGASFCALDQDILFVQDLLSCLLDFDCCADWAADIRRRVHPDAPLLRVQAACREIRSEYAARLADLAKEKRQTLRLSGHSHLDLGYLWPIRETRRKALRTFSSMLSLMDENPAFTFTQSQTVLYEWVQQDDPQLFEKIKEKIREGRWTVAGGMYVESDANIPAPESIIRQFLYGMDYAEKELGAQPEIAFLPDTFGLSAALPQILKGCGMKILYTAKIRSNAYYEFPFTHYRWEGIDGSRIPAHLCPFGTYSGDMTAFQLKSGMNICQKTGANAALAQPYLIGFGDGGGGTTPEMLRKAPILSGLPGLPAMDLFPGDEAFRPLEEAESALPIWREEMYYDLHQGTLTSQAALKMDNRLLESAFFRAEWLDAVTGGQHEAALRQGWKTLLLHQFHDILPGSCQKSVFDQAHGEQQALLKNLQDIQLDCLKRLSNEGGEDDLLLINPLPHAQCLEMHYQGKWIAETMPPFSAKQATLLPVPALPSMIRQTREGFQMDNGLLRVCIDGASGAVTGLYSYTAKQEMLSAPAYFTLHDELYEFYDAWNFDQRSLQQSLALPSPALMVECDDGAEARLLLLQPLSDESSLECRMILRRGCPRLDLEIQVHWQECGRLLRFQAPSTLYARQAFYDLGYGAVGRSTGSTFPFEKAQIEAACRRWMDLSDASCGLALMNIGKYGGIVKENTLYQTLLKSPRYPDDQADLGDHAFTLSLYPHKGNYSAGQVPQEAARLENPLLLMPGRLAKTTCPLLPWQDQPGLSLGAVKKAHDGSGDWIFRVFEPQGGAWQGTMDFSFLQPKAVWLCNMLEKKEHALPLQNGCISLTLSPFQIMTLRIET